MSVPGSVISVAPKLALINPTAAGLKLVVPLPSAGETDCSLTGPVVRRMVNLRYEGKSHLRCNKLVY